MTVLLIATPDVIQHETFRKGGNGTRLLRELGRRPPRRVFTKRSLVDDKRVGVMV